MKLDSYIVIKILGGLNRLLRSHYFRRRDKLRGAKIISRRIRILHSGHLKVMRVMIMQLINISSN